MMYVCPYCKGEIDEEEIKTRGYKFCHRCGKPLVRGKGN